MLVEKWELRRRSAWFVHLHGVRRVDWHFQTQGDNLRFGYACSCYTSRTSRFEPAKGKAKSGGPS